MCFYSDIKVPAGKISPSMRLTEIDASGDELEQGAHLHPSLLLLVPGFENKDWHGGEESCRLDGGGVSKL